MRERERESGELNEKEEREGSKSSQSGLFSRYQWNFTHAL